MTIDRPRRHHRIHRVWIGRVAAPLMALQLLMLLSATAGAHAATPVAWISAEPEAAYTATRVYAGRTRATRAAELGFRQAGELQAILVPEGAVVAAGQPLARQNSDTLQARLLQAEADVRLALANVRALQAEVDLAVATEARLTSLRENAHVSAQSHDEARLNLAARRAQLGVAEASLERARAARTAADIALAEATLNAPFAGVIQARHRDEGSQLGAGESVFRLVETARLEADIGLPEEVAGVLAPGQEYALLWGGARHEARLETVLPEVDATTRTRRAVFSLDDAVVPPGAVVELALAQSVTVSGYWLPLTALVEADRGLWGVFVINATGILERRLVEIVHSESDRAFVRGTLAARERVVRTGVQRLVVGQQVDALQASAAQ